MFTGSRYSAIVRQYFLHNPHAGCLTDMTGDCYQAEVGYSPNGDVLVLSVKIVAQQIQQARFLAYGGVVLISAAEWVCEYLESKSVTSLSLLVPEHLQRALGLSAVYSHIPQLVIQAIQQLYQAYIRSTSPLFP